MSSLFPWKHALPGVVLSVIFLIGTAEKSQAQLGAPQTPGPNADAKAYVDFGTANGVRGDLNGAIKAFQSAISLDPKYAPAYCNLGYAESLQNNNAAALAAYAKAIELAPNYRDAYNQRGNLKGRNGDFAGAIPDYQQVVRISPNYPPAHYSLGHVYYFTGDLAKATKELDKALALDPKFAFAYYIRGLIRHAQGHNTDATADFRKALGLDFPDAAFWIYLCESEDGLAEAARTDLTNAVAKPEAFRPDDFPIVIGNFLLGNLPQDQLIAKASSASADARDKCMCAAWFYAGMAQRLVHDMPDARACFDKAIATNSKGSEEYVEAVREKASMPGL